MANVNRVVDTESNSKDNIDTGDDVNCDAPEVEKSNNISEGTKNNENDHDTDLNVAEKKESDNKNTNHSQSNVPPQLISNNLISLPSSIHFAVTESVRRIH